MLRPLQEIFPAANHPELLIGLDGPDDAAVYKLSDELALVQTVDFFPPVVDDPYTYGAVAAANAMSDVYAMGGEVLLALQVVGFPEDQPVEILTEIFRGGAEKVAEAGGIIVGGHTLFDEEPKYGLAVTGTVHPDEILRKAGAQPGDVLLLTKALGTGVVLTASREDACAPDLRRMASGRTVPVTQRPYLGSLSITVWPPAMTPPASAIFSAPPRKISASSSAGWSSGKPTTCNASSTSPPMA